MPEKIIGLTRFLDFFDRGHSLASFLPPQAAVSSLPLPVYAKRSLVKQRTRTSKPIPISFWGAAICTGFARFCLLVSFLPKIYLLFSSTIVPCWVYLPVLQ